MDEVKKILSRLDAVLQVSILIWTASLMVWEIFYGVQNRLILDTVFWSWAAGFGFLIVAMIIWDQGKKTLE